MSKPSFNGEPKPTPAQAPTGKGLPGFPYWSKLLPWRNGQSASAGHAQPGETSTPATTAPPPLPSPQFTAFEQEFMLHLARRALERAATERIELPASCAKDCPPRLLQPAACFVTLTCKGELRGCVGNILPREPLCLAVATSAHNAALSDPRFPPVNPDELDQIRIEVSVLTEPIPLSFASPEELLNQLRPHEHGVVLQLGSQTATFLPKVWDQLADKTEFLNHLAQKAGGAPAAWRSKGVSVSVYHVQSFAEN